MKKIIYIIIILVFPLSVAAYSNKIIPGGENIGIYVKEKGITVIGFYDVDGVNNNELKIGDHIVSANNEPINTINELISVIKKTSENEIDITYIRNNKSHNGKLSLVKINNEYKTGLYVKDNITGLGTLTYIDPLTHIFGSLGHEIIDSNTKEQITIDNGYIFNSIITNIKKSKDGNPGGIYAKFNNKNKYGTITKNTNVGIYGNYDELPDKEYMEIADPKIGKAYIMTELDNSGVKKYEINIKTLNDTSRNKNIYFEIVDEELINKTGGVVQGMSGSPIIQDNKIVGAVTHVIVDNVKTGYGVYIKTMLSEGESK